MTESGKKKYINSVKMLRVVIKSLIMSAAYYQYLPTAPVWYKYICNKLVKGKN